MDRKAKIATAALLVAVAAAVGFFVWDVIITRPQVDRDGPHQKFGIDRANTAAPAFELAALDGSRVSLESLRGQVVFVNFWATWCPPCRDEMPSMVRLGQDLSRRYPGKFRMLAISVDDGWDPVKEYFAAPPFAGAPAAVQIALDTSAQSAKAYYCTARGFCPDIKFPETYIVDKTGKLVGYIVGPRNWNDPSARQYLESIIGS